MFTYSETYQRLLKAVQQGYDHQIDLIAVMEEAYAFLEEEEDRLSDEEVLAMRILLKQAETQAGRYFGM